MSRGEAYAAIGAAVVHGFVDAELARDVDVEAVVGAVAAVRASGYPGYDGASAAPLIDWGRLRRRGETREAYAARVETPNAVE